MELVGRLSQNGSVGGRLTNTGALSGSFSFSTGGIPYSGDYDFTPTEELQTVSIAGKTASENITIQPIPTNYGRIERQGTILTIS